jgi:filamentous hemagglutinin family protein
MTGFDFLKVVHTITFAIITGFLPPFISPINAVEPSIVADGSLGTKINVSGSDYTISDGTIHGGNQFHSFGRFNIFKGESATFTGPRSIGNIIGRVTGGSDSLINGLLSSEINGADLYLLNPSGVLFGPNARLDLSGSFHVSTADYLRLGENGIFYANIANNSQLTSDPPSAFGFLSGNPETIEIDESMLEVTEGNELSLIGGDIIINGGVLKAPSGAIRIASTESTGEINANTLDPTDAQLNRSTATSNQIEITNQTYLDTSGVGAGTIRIKGGKFVIEDSYIDANNHKPKEEVDAGTSEDFAADDTTFHPMTEEKDNSGKVGIYATKSVRMKNSLVSGETFNDNGNGTPLKIETENLEIIDGTIISTGTYGSGNGGNITIKANNILLSGKSPTHGLTTTVFSGTAVNSTGNGATLEIAADTLTLEAGAQIEMSSYGTGKAGDINIQTDLIRLTPVDRSGVDTGLYTGIFSEGKIGGNGGNVNIKSKDLEIFGGSRISSRTFGLGASGSIDIESENILLSGYNSYEDWPSGIFTASETNSTGNGGVLKIVSDNLILESGAKIISSSLGEGNAGNIYLDLGHIHLTPSDANGTDTGLFTGIFAEGVNGGNGGRIDLHSQILEVLDGAWISSWTYGSGNAGRIDIEANNIWLYGKNLSQGWASSIYSGSSGGATGNGGDLKIRAENLDIEAGAQIMTTSFGTGNAGNISLNADQVRLTTADTDGSSTNYLSGIYAEGKSGGNGGNIDIYSQDLEIKDGAYISSRTFNSGKAGSISVKGEDIQISGRSPSQRWTSGIFSGSSTTSTGTGGDVKITGEALTVSAGAKISTNSYGIGDAGNIELDVNHIRLTPLNADGTDTGLSTGIFTEGVNGGNSGDIRIGNKSLEILDGAYISSMTSGSGAAGRIEVISDNILLSGRNLTQGWASGIFTYSGEDATGNGGDLTITTDTLRMEAGSRLYSGSRGPGHAGNIYLDSQDIFITGSETKIFTGGEALAGKIAVESKNLQILDGAELKTEGSFTGIGSEDIDIKSNTVLIENGGKISTTTHMNGKNTGSINIDANYIRLASVDAKGNPTERHTGIYSDTWSWEGESAGSINILCEILEILGGASITSDARMFNGTGGNINVNAGRVVISGKFPHIDWSSQISAEANNGRKSGNIKINSDSLFVDENGIISTNVSGNAEGGEIDINTNLLSLDSNAQISSITTGVGQGGRIKINTKQYQQKNDSEISAKSSGEGNAGEIYISSKGKLLLQDSAILVEATQSDGGNIKVMNNHMVMLRNSKISSSVEGGPSTVGGNISIDPEFVILKDSDIIAKAVGGKGGEITIVTDYLLKDDNSLIDASSDGGGIDGTVNIHAAFEYLSTNPASLSENFKSAVELLKEPCLTRMQGGQYNSLVITGRGTLSAGPGGLLPSPAYVK